MGREFTNSTPATAPAERASPRSPEEGPIVADFGFSGETANLCHDQDRPITKPHAATATAPDRAIDPRRRVTKKATAKVNAANKIDSRFTVFADRHPIGLTDRG